MVTVELSQRPNTGVIRTVFRGIEPVQAEALDVARLVLEHVMEGIDHLVEHLTPLLEVLSTVVFVLCSKLSSEALVLFDQILVFCLEH